MSKANKKTQAAQKPKSSPVSAPKATAATRNSTGSENGYMQQLPIFGLLLLTYMILSPMLGFEFVNWDDEVNIHDNPNLRAFDWASIKGIFTSDVIGNYNPLTILTFAIEKHFFGIESARIFHLNNLLLHLLVVYLVYRCSLSLGLKQIYALMVAALFALHPMRIESVAWVTERKDVLFASFYFFALWQYILLQKSDKKPIWRYVAIYVAFALALLSKIQAVSLPLSMLCVDYLLKRPMKLSVLLEKAPYFLLSLGAGILGIYMLSEQKSLDAGELYSLWQRLLIGASGYVVYLLKWIFPWAMSPLYPYPKELLWYHYAAPLGVLASAAWCWYAWKKEWRHVVFGLGFFFLNVVFLLQIVGAGQGYWADRFTYVPYFGLFFLMAAGFSALSDKMEHLRTPLLLGTALYILILSVVTYKQNFVWKNPENLWTRAMEYEKKSPLPFTNRAQYYRRQKQYDLAEKDYREAIRLKPEASTYNSLAKMYFDNNKPDLAIENYLEGIKRDSTIAEVWINLGAANGMKNNYDAAKMYMTKGLSIDSTNLNGYLNRGLVRYLTGDFEGALADNRAYLRFNPYNYDMYYESGLNLNQLKRYDEAIVAFNTALKGKPDLNLAYHERAKTYYLMGKKAEAKADAEKARQMGIKNIDPRLFE